MQRANCQGPVAAVDCGRRARGIRFAPFRMARYPRPMVPTLLSKPGACLGSGDVHRLDEDGYLVLRGAIPAAWLAPLRAAFEGGAIPLDQWPVPVPRGREWRHSLLDLDPYVQRVCRLPALLGGVQHRLRQPFFLSQVEGREPRCGNDPQLLHRDGAGQGGRVMAGMVWLDPYGADNGATQIVPGSHRSDAADNSDAVIIAGAAGDILLFDPDVLHGATTNRTGAPRRSLLLSYAVTALRVDHLATEAVRNVRMDTSEIFG